MSHFQNATEHEMQMLLQNNINIGDGITSKFQTLEGHVKDCMRRITQDNNKIDLKKDHNTLHFEKVLNKHKDNQDWINKQLEEVVKNAVEKYDKSLNENIFKVNQGQDETISLVNAITKDIESVKEETKCLDSVLLSFDKHITDIHNAINIMPSLHKTMTDIVEVLNTTMGEELVEAPDVMNAKTNVEAIDMSIDRDSEQVEEIAHEDGEEQQHGKKPRASKRTTNRKKK
jgi:hypothetical protein